MSKKADRIQYTIRGIPSDVDRALRKKAAQRRVSLNRIVVEELTAATVGRGERPDFSSLVGKWIADPGFDEIIASHRRIDPEKWGPTS